MVFRRGLIWGKAGDGDPVVEAFCGVTRGFTYQEPRQVGSADELKDILLQDGATDTLVLYLASMGHAQAALQDNVRFIRGRGARVIVYADIKDHYTALAIDCLNAGADDFVIWEESNPDALVRRIKDIHLGQPAFHKIEVALSPRTGKPGVFVATPYETSKANELREAVNPALVRLGMSPVWSDNLVQPSMAIHDKVKEDIGRCHLMIANIVEADEPSSQHNPNVYLEMGIAYKQGIPVILVRPKKDQDKRVPVDIQGLEHITHSGPLDLAKQLYFGLRHLRKNEQRTP